jgi:hypothetical protein
MDSRLLGRCEKKVDFGAMTIVFTLSPVLVYIGLEYQRDLEVLKRKFQLVRISLLCELEDSFLQNMALALFCDRGKVV